MKKNVLALGLCCLMGTLFAQNEQEQLLKFSEKTFDVGRKWEHKGKISHVYMITNIGEKESRLLECKADSKWKNISFEWDSDHIGQYERIHLKATMDPTGMRYSFQIPFKLTMLLGKDTVVYNMCMRGYVDPKPASREEEFSMQEGNLKYIQNAHSFSRLGQKSVVQDTFKFLNVWDSVMTFRKGNIPAGITIQYLTSELKPGEEGIVAYTFNAEATKDWGYVYNHFTLLTNDPEPASHNGRKTFYYGADVYDDFSSWTPEQMKNAPRILTDHEKYDFGECISGDEIKHDFKITNIGKSDLIIRKVKTSCGCTTSKLDKDTLAPGESTLVRAVFRTANKKGVQPKNIDIITNDPEQPKVVLTITGNIREKSK